MSRRCHSNGECTAEAADPSGPCPRCGKVGRAVADETIAAILRPDAARPLLAVSRKFCRTPACDVVYYGADGRIALKSDATVRVGIKERADPVPLCYCFGVDRTDLVRELHETGRSTIPEWIAAEVRAGRCACETKNPSGVCCLGEVHGAAREALESILPNIGSTKP